MIQENDFTQELTKLSLPEVLEREDLVLQEIFSIKDIHNKIKRNMNLFINYCISHHQFTTRLISLGLKCPMHESNNHQMKNITYIAADILTCDHQSLADLFILPGKKPSDNEELLQNGEEIEEEIETEDGQIAKQTEKDKYLYLLQVLDYVNSEVLDQNCLNYIAKALYILIRRKLSQFLQFFKLNDQILKKLVSISHYPSIAHFLAKLLTDDEDNISQDAMDIKTKLIPFLLSKLHNEIDRAEISQVFECIEDVLNSSRYGDVQDRSHLQKMSDVMVSSTQISFYLSKIISCLQTAQKTPKLYYQTINSIHYITLMLNRMNMDEQQDYNFNETPNQFKPTLQYQIDILFLSFCKLVSLLDKLWQFQSVIHSQFGFAPVKAVEPLIAMTRHSRFGKFYSEIDKGQRLSAIRTLIDLAYSHKARGILVQNIANLIEKMLIQEERLAETPTQIVFPADLFQVIKQHSVSIGDNIKLLLQQTLNQRNKNQNGVYFRKILLILDNYFKHIAVIKRYPDTGRLQDLFPSFNIQNCRLYAQKASILGHPLGAKVKQVEEFVFLQKNRVIMRTTSPQLLPEDLPPQEQSFPKPPQQPSKKSTGLVFKIDGKLKALKERVKQRNPDKVQNDQPASRPPKTQDLHPPSLPSPNPPSPDQLKTGSPCKNKQQTGLNFFIRHLMIY